MTRLHGKRIFDVVVSGIMLVVLSPLIAGVALLVRLRLGSPVLFRQQRPGLHEKPFVLYKFRTMRDVYGETNELLPDDERLTRLGQTLRSLSLDELPQLFNVFVGDMSLVGPRPLLMEYLALYSSDEARRHSVRPGITGWAQIHGRNTLDWRRRFAYDVWYVDHRSMWLDFRVLLATLGRVVSRSGINEPGQSTMRRFEHGESWRTHVNPREAATLAAGDEPTLASVDMTTSPGTACSIRRSSPGAGGSSMRRGGSTASS